jgi:hypothetical protein
VYMGDILPQKKRQPERAGAGAFSKQPLAIST